MQSLGAIFTPVLSSAAGSCLTVANWLDIKVDVATYYLEALLMKPGVDFFKALQPLRQYLGWSGKLILNAAALNFNEDGYCKIRSCFDGSIITISQSELLSLITILNPDCVLLPEAFNTQILDLPESILVFFPANLMQPNNSKRQIGRYFNKELQSCKDLLQEIKQDCFTAKYVIGELTYPESNQLISELSSVDNLYIESDNPAKDAVNGIIYSSNGRFNLDLPEMAQLHITLDVNCQCPTCTQQLTRAYLHHLFTQTPLLCKRFLIQHNIYFMKFNLRGL